MRDVSLMCHVNRFVCAIRLSAIFKAIALLGVENSFTLNDLSDECELICPTFHVKNISVSMFVCCQLSRLVRFFAATAAAVVVTAATSLVPGYSFQCVSLFSLEMERKNRRTREHDQ